MTLDWPLVVLSGMCLTAAVVALRVVLPYLRSKSEEDARRAALDELNKRLSAVEGQMTQPRFPARVR